MIARGLGISAVVAIGVAGSGCDVPSQCIARGTVTTHATSAIYTLDDGTGAGAISGTASSNVTIDDYTPSCVYDREQFTMTIGSCSFVATAGSGTFTEDGDVIESSASADPGQECDLVLTEGTAHVLIDHAYVAQDGDGVMRVGIAGTASVWRGTTANDHLDYRAVATPD